MQGLRVLVIEDHAVMRQIITDTFKRCGFTVLAAENGRSGVALARDQQPDLIVCDLQMPEWNGLAVLETLRAHRGTEDIPFIVLTAQAEVSMREWCFRIGANAFVEKAGGVEALMQAVQDVLGARTENGA